MPLRLGSKFQIKLWKICKRQNLTVIIQISTVSSIFFLNFWILSLIGFKILSFEIFTLLQLSLARQCYDLKTNANTGKVTEVVWLGGGAECQKNWKNFKASLSKTGQGSIFFPIGCQKNLFLSITCKIEPF